MDLQEQFEVYKATKGDCVSKLLKAGYALESLKEDEIASVEDFREVVGRSDCLRKDDLKADLKKIFGNRISAENIKKLLSMDQEFAVSLLDEALRLIPSDEDGSVLVETFVDFLYK